MWKIAEKCNAFNPLGFENPTYLNLPVNTSVATGFMANKGIGTNVEDQYDETQTFLIQLPSLPIYGRMGATGDVAPLIGWGRLKSVYNGDTEVGAVWYEPTNPPYITLNNEVEITLNQIQIRLTDEHGVNLKCLEPHTSVLLEFTPNPPTGPVTQVARAAQQLSLAVN